MNHTSYQSKSFTCMSPAYAVRLKNTPQKRHSQDNTKVNFRLHIIKRIYTAVSSSGHLTPLHRTVHYMKHKSLDGAFIVRCSSHQLFEVGEKEVGAFAIARSGFEPFRLCHDYVMGIRSCELSEPLHETSS